jgi:hypothetical protein
MGPSGSRQVHAAQPDRGPRPADRGRGHGGRAADRRPGRGRAGPVPGPARRDHLPVLQPAGRPHGGEDNVLLPAQLAGAARTAVRGRGPPSCWQRLGIEGHKRRLPGAAVGWPAAAGGDRPGAGELARSCCWRTSRPGRWTRRPARRSARLLRRAERRRARRWCLITHDPALAGTVRRPHDRDRGRQVVEGQAGHSCGCGGAGMSRPTTSWPLLGSALLAGWARSGPPPRYAAAQGADGRARHAVLLVSTASATLGFALLAASNAPFQHAFAAQRGADVAVSVNAARASSQRSWPAPAVSPGSPRRPGRSPRPRSRCSSAASRSGRSCWLGAPRPAARSTTWC